MKSSIINKKHVCEHFINLLLNPNHFGQKKIMRKKLKLKEKKTYTFRDSF